MPQAEAPFHMHINRHNTHHTMIDLKEIRIRETTISDFNNIMRVEEQAFGYDKEARLTAELLADKSAEPIVSLLAFNGLQEQPLMHILAPLAVKPAYQGQGIGGRLIKAGLQLLEEKGSNLVFVLGHREYDPRYGFLPQATNLDYTPPYPLPDEFPDYWMVHPLGRTGFAAGKGNIKCSDTLNKPEHWRDEESDR